MALIPPDPAAQMLELYIEDNQVLLQSMQQGLQRSLSQVASGARSLTDMLYDDSGWAFTVEDGISTARDAIASIQARLDEARALVGQGSQAVTDFLRSKGGGYFQQLRAVAPAVETEAEGVVTTLEENPAALVTIPVAVGAARAAAGSTLRGLVAGGIRGSWGGWAGVGAGVLIAALLALGGWAWSNSGSSGGGTTVHPSASTTLTLPTTSTTYPLYQAPPQYTVPPSVPQPGGPSQQGGPSQPGTPPTTHHVIICDPIEPHQPCVPSS